MIAAKNSSVSLLHRRAQRLVEVGKHALVGRGDFQVAQLQPLAGEVLDQRLRLGVGQHPLDLPLEVVALAQRAAPGQREQLVVGHAAPQEVRQPRGQLVVVERANGLRIAGRRAGSSSTRNRKCGETSIACTASAIALEKSSPSASASATSLQHAIDLGRGRRPAKGPGHEAVDDLAGQQHLVLGRVLARDDPLVRAGGYGPITSRFDDDQIAIVRRLGDRART